MKRPDIDDLERVNLRVLDIMNAEQDRSGAEAAMTVLGLITYTRDLERIITDIADEYANPNVLSEKRARRIAALHDVIALVGRGTP